MQNESLLLFSFPSAGNFSEAKITQKREKCKMKACFYFISECPVTSAKLNYAKTREINEMKFNIAHRVAFEMVSRCVRDEHR